MWASVIAVIGTLAGAVVASVMQQRAARADRKEARAEERRRDAVQAVTNLTVALADHRRTMWLREAARLTGESEADIAAARAQSHTTRAAVTAPHVAVTLLAPELTAHADRAVRAAYALRDATDAESLSALRDAALESAEQFTASAAHTLAS
jgi:hypothetical protein